MIKKAIAITALLIGLGFMLISYDAFAKEALTIQESILSFFSETTK